MPREKTFLVTGAAGFIGFFLSRKLLEEGSRVIGFDNMNSYYDVNLKEHRLGILKSYRSFEFIKGDISDMDAVGSCFGFCPDIVVHLAAQAGVRYSLENPEAYVQSNLVGFFNIIEACRKNPVDHLVYASSSSVYGLNSKVPFAESDPADHPVSLYAATKKADELMAYTYSHLFGIPATGLRFFTVYGPLGRPDMAYFDFTNKYFRGEPVRIFNGGDFKNDLYRDFTYIDDIIDGIMKVIPKAPAGEDPHRVYNIGNSKPVELMKFIGTLERCLSRASGKEVVFEKIFEPIKAGDVPATFADLGRISEAVGYSPKTSIEGGLQKFAEWYVEYYKQDML